MAEHYLELEADDYLLKPVSPRLLRARLDNVLANASAMALDMEN